MKAILKIPFYLVCLAVSVLSFYFIYKNLLPQAKAIDSAIFTVCGLVWYKLAYRILDFKK